MVKWIENIIGVIFYIPIILLIIVFSPIAFIIAVLNELIKKNY